MKSSTPRGDKLLLTCEHGGNRLPSPWHTRLNIPAKILASHRAWDPGALRLAKYFHRRLPSHLVTNEVTRLLVDFNRSSNHRDLFSAFGSGLTEVQRNQVIQKYYLPYWDAIRDQIDAWYEKGCRVLHLSVHSFTPRLRGKRRLADLGFLYDPSRPLERNFVAQLGQGLKSCLPNYRYRKNYPYRGISDGLIPALRKKYDGPQYLGIELEFNQALVAGWNPRAQNLAKALVKNLQKCFPHL